MGEKHRVGRLAFREEGDQWIAYFADDGTMQGALELGRIARRFVDRPDRKHQFMDLMRDCFSDTVQSTTGIRPSWGGPEKAPEKAPENERRT